MTEPWINSLIKSSCGRAKYSELIERKGFVNQLRLVWFVVFAALRDWRLPDKNQSDPSDS